MQRLPPPPLPPSQAQLQTLPLRSLPYRPLPAYAVTPEASHAQPTYAVARGPSHSDVAPSFVLQATQPHIYASQRPPPPTFTRQPTAHHSYDIQPAPPATHAFHSLAYRPRPHAPSSTAAAQPFTYPQPRTYAQTPTNTPPQSYARSAATTRPRPVALVNMPPAKKRKPAPTSTAATQPARKKARKIAASSSSYSPSANVIRTRPTSPCHNGSSHFHRLRCGHIVKTPLSDPPTACATNCEHEPQPNPADNWGPAPFACPVCIARALSMLWKMDVVDLRKQHPTLDFPAYAAWVRDNYVKAWEQRRDTRVKHWIPNPRPCAQLSVRERALVRWRPDEAKAPYPIEEFRRLYERREVKAEFWECEYKDLTVVESQWEAEPGTVYRSVERPGVHYPAEVARAI